MAFVYGYFYPVGGGGTKVSVIRLLFLIDFSYMIEQWSLCLYGILTPTLTLTLTPAVLLTLTLGFLMCEWVVTAIL